MCVYVIVHLDVYVVFQYCRCVYVPILLYLERSSSLLYVVYGYVEFKVVISRYSGADVQQHPPFYSLRRGYMVKMEGL